MKIWSYVFNIILAIIFFFIAGWHATKCGGEFNKEFVSTIIWLAITAWDVCVIFFMMNEEKIDKLDEIKKNQEKILKHLEGFHNIDMVFKND